MHNHKKEIHDNNNLYINSRLFQPLHSPTLDFSFMTAVCLVNKEVKLKISLPILFSSIVNLITEATIDHPNSRVVDFHAIYPLAAS